METLKPKIFEITLDNSIEELFCKLYGQPNMVLLDSSMVIKGLGEFSFFAFDPFLILKYSGQEICLIENGNEKKIFSDPFDTLEEILGRYFIDRGDCDIPFLGGGIGFFGYDLNRLLERLPNFAIDDLEFPDIYFMFFMNVIAVDHFRKKCFLIVNSADHAPSSVEQLDEILCRGEKEWTTEQRFPPEVRSNFSKDEYLKAVEVTKEYIRAGDIYQANLSQRFVCSADFTPLELYLRLRKINPAPFSCFIEFDDKAVLSSSPERFLKVEGSKVITRPIKGTRPRGSDGEEDERLKSELLQSEKDIAELTMIIDLERNDLSRVCKYGSVKVKENKKLESYPTVHHLVGTIEGELREGKTLIDLIKATFPGGSITGAPKIRAMEIIEELEPTKRKVYTGAIGFIGFDKTMDLNIAIRTILMKNKSIFYQVGGGIVADSEPEMEYKETLSKGEGLYRAVCGREYH